MEICFKECEINKLDFITFDSNVLYEDGYSSSDLREIDRSNILDSKICSGKILFNKMMESKSSLASAYLIPILFPYENPPFSSAFIIITGLPSCLSLILLQPWIASDCEYTIYGTGFVTFG